MRAKIYHILGYDAAIELLARTKNIVAVRYRNGYLVARWGVNKTTLVKYAKQLDGEK